MGHCLSIVAVGDDHVTIGSYSDQFPSPAVTEHLKKNLYLAETSALRIIVNNISITFMASNYASLCFIDYHSFTCNYHMKIALHMRKVIRPSLGAIK
jgi:hypothetical protein